MLIKKIEREERSQNPLQSVTCFLLKLTKIDHVQAGADREGGGGGVVVLEFLLTTPFQLEIWQRVSLFSSITANGKN